ncbi:serine/threonine dehydratase [Chloropicon primus]|uniref:L-serine ammonia-lyase n=1 Tax=Chloropicon primus TaxID=1764295 RepID=A0A5B8MJ36_9CHLO|nr:serine/threonine dehydratase [Chloropicon primus]UPQ99850.1 serine/threonine dehydratase [Chloropicon primus]|eukprot:QDZ20638.1 serine/threonine dehydratase [Chloropicon primus]
MSAAAKEVSKEALHLRTPLVLSKPLSERVGVKTYLKLDNLQPTGSFKVRGMGAATQRAKERGCSRLVSSSGGNAGLATAYCGNVLNLRTTVVLPTTASENAKRKVASLGAEVVVEGGQWSESNSFAEGLVAESESSGDKAVLIHPFYGEDIWEGNSTLVDEIAEQLPAGVKPSAILASVGGGGLLMGILQGLRKRGWREDVKVLACETFGANALALSLEKKERVEIAITSVAKSLGADKIGEDILKECFDPGYDLEPFVATDEEAVGSCFKFALDHGMLVEPSCGAALSPIYYHSERVRELAKGEDKCIVVEVCGGGAFNSIETLQAYAEQLGLDLNGDKII